MLGSGFIAPLGRSRSRRYMFSGEVTMCRALVIGTSTRKITKARKCTDHTIWWVVEMAPWEAPSKAADRGQPMNDHFSKSGRPTSWMRSASVTKPVRPISAKVPRMTWSSALVLIFSR